MTKHNIPKTIRYNEGILRGMFTALSAYIKTETWEIQINNLIMQLKALENKPLPLEKVDRNRESKSELNLIKLKQTNNTKNQWNKVLVFLKRLTGYISWKECHLSSDTRIQLGCVLG